MCTLMGHFVRGATLLGAILSVPAISVRAQEIMHEGAVTGSKTPSEEQDNKIDYKNAEAMPLPAAPDSLARQAEKDLIDNLVNRNRPVVSGPAGLEPGSEGNGMPNSVEPRTPSGPPNPKKLKRP
ncbi:MAG: hypothetical protein ACT4PN_10155 [Nitrospiraceae bacterium]